MLTVDQLLAVLTRDLMKAKLYEVASFLGLPTTAWFSGAPTRGLIAVLAEVYGAFMAPLIVVLFKSGFLDDAETGWLTLLAAKHFGVTRREATFASEEVDLVNGGGGIYNFEIAEAVFKNSTTDATYTNIEPIALGALGSQTVALRALVLGSAGNATPGQIDSIVTTMPDVTVTHSTTFVGVDEETDTELRDRSRARLGALSAAGPGDAYRFIALTPEFNNDANINRAKVMPAPGNGTVTVLLAAPDGAPIPADVTLVQEAFDAWAEPDTGLSIATAATNYDHALGATVYVNAAAGLTNAEWIELIKANLIAWVRSLPIEGLELTPGSRLIPYRSVIGVIERTRQNANEAFYVLHAALDSQVDVSLPAQSVVRLDEADITLTINQVIVQA